ncbi:negative regulator of beta-lactamase expression [Pseudanabaena sp. lw0831]|uniref:peptidoglycan recognition protein family protein n=1 Tax=Pseudanabaena sp. lw0831 TaxID=1357935 RepID=UPI001915E62F|nr:peptidoglycan recognition family protein [Pseudanabaena sp. lw0831]GBO52345.1 negative regulator of beta-lactamase expression [Pseudanabaena sp. lw0831]
MQFNRLVAIAFFFLTLVIFILLAEPAKTKVIADAKFTESRPKIPQRTTQRIAQNISFSPEINQFAPVKGCENQPPANPPEPSLPAALTSTPITLERFRKPLPPSTVNSTSSQKGITYNPKEVIALAAASNYGERYLKDLSGQPANNPPIIVLHETVGSANSVINFFQEFHTDEDSQASYHTLITLEGTIIYFVPPDKRALGAGNSIFVSSLGKEAIQTNPRYPSSVNNFAYHISLETPADGMHDGYTHSGYTEAQYQSLAWLVAKTDVPLERITTHRIVDRSGSRIDPRSFNFNLFQKQLSEYSRTKEISIGCPSTP